MILNRTRSASERHRVIPGSMGCHGLPPNHPNHHFEVATGIDRGNGYQGYCSVSYALGTQSHLGRCARANLRAFLIDKGFEVPKADE